MAITRNIANALRDLGANVSQFLNDGTLNFNVNSPNSNSEQPVQNQIQTTENSSVHMPPQGEMSQNIPQSPMVTQANVTLSLPESLPVVSQVTTTFPPTLNTEVSLAAVQNPQLNTENSNIYPSLENLSSPSASDFVSNDVYYWDGSSGTGASHQLSTRVVSDAPTPCIPNNAKTNYNEALEKIDWLASRSLQDSYVSLDGVETSRSILTGGLRTPGAVGGVLPVTTRTGAVETGRTQNFHGTTVVSASRNLNTNQTHQRQYVDWFKQNFPFFKNQQVSNSNIRQNNLGAIPKTSSVFSNTPPNTVPNCNPRGTEQVVLTNTLTTSQSSQLGSFQAAPSVNERPSPILSPQQIVYTSNSTRPISHCNPGVLQPPNTLPYCWSASGVPIVGNPHPVSVAGLPSGTIPGHNAPLHPEAPKVPGSVMSTGYSPYHTSVFPYPNYNYVPAYPLPHGFPMYPQPFPGYMQNLPPQMPYIHPQMPGYPPMPHYAQQPLDTLPQISSGNSTMPTTVRFAQSTPHAGQPLPPSELGSAIDHTILPQMADGRTLFNSTATNQVDSPRSPRDDFNRTFIAGNNPNFIPNNAPQASPLVAGSLNPGGLLPSYPLVSQAMTSAGSIDNPASISQRDLHQTAAAGEITSPGGNSNSMPFSLPLVDIGTFDGDFAEYKEFRIKVQSVLAACRYSTEMKVIYLKSRLVGDPAQSVAGIMPDDLGAYEEIWRVLDEDYGTPALGFDHHLNLLLQISTWPECSNDGDLKRLYRHLSVNYAAIAHYGEDAVKAAEAAKVFILPILTGYAANKVTKLRENGINYNIPNILRTLKGIVAHSRFLESSKSLRHESRRESRSPRKAYDESGCCNGDVTCCFVKSSLKDRASSSEKRVTFKPGSPKRRQSPSPDRNRLSRAPVRYQTPPRQPSPVRFKCQFCQSNEHDLDNCNLYDNRDRYWEHILRNRWCSNCLKPGHQWKDCYQHQSCKLACGRADKHVSVLCDKFYKT